MVMYLNKPLQFHDFFSRMRDALENRMRCCGALFLRNLQAL